MSQKYFLKVLHLILKSKKLFRRNRLFHLLNLPWPIQYSTSNRFFRNGCGSLSPIILFGNLTSSLVTWIVMLAYHVQIGRFVSHFLMISFGFRIHLLKLLMLNLLSLLGIKISVSMKLPAIPRSIQRWFESALTNVVKGVKMVTSYLAIRRHSAKVMVARCLLGSFPIHGLSSRAVPWSVSLFIPSRSILIDSVTGKPPLVEFFVSFLWWLIWQCLTHVRPMLIHVQNVHESKLRSWSANREW